MEGKKKDFSSSYLKIPDIYCLQYGITAQYDITSQKVHVDCRELFVSDVDGSILVLEFYLRDHFLVVSSALFRAHSSRVGAVVGRGGIGHSTLSPYFYAAYSLFTTSLCRTAVCHQSSVFSEPNRTPDNSSHPSWRQLSHTLPVSCKEISRMLLRVLSSNRVDVKPVPAVFFKSR